MFSEIRAQVGCCWDFGLLQNAQVTNWGLAENRVQFQHIVTTTKNHGRYNDVF